MENSTQIINQISLLIKLKSSIPEDVNEFKDIFKSIIKKAGLTTVADFHYKFSPIGMTILFVLSESHLGIHTWPEKNMIHIDLVTCQKESVEDFIIAIKSEFSEIENLKIITNNTNYF